MQVFLGPFSVPLAMTAWIYDSSNVSKALSNKAADLNRFSLGDDIAVCKYKTMEINVRDDERLQRRWSLS